MWDCGEVNYCLMTKAIPRRHMGNEEEASMASSKRILGECGVLTPAWPLRAPMVVSRLTLLGCQLYYPDTFNLV